MEKIPAACAMEWSIELDRGLRSRNPEKALEAVEQIGPRLLLWSMHPPGIPLEVLNMYGLVQGEDIAFANAILLRLAEAFRTGDNQLRASIVKVFGAEWKCVIRKGRNYDGILVKERVPNYLDMLKKVKWVYDTGDIEAKVLSLRLLGCWATFSKDNAHTRHMILSSLRSPHLSEVTASLFAAGNISMLTKDFPCIILSILVDIIHSEAPSTVKLAVTRAFGKMQSSCSVVNKAYKAGKQLVLHIQQGKVAAQMVLSLSKLAMKSIILFAQQMDFLWTLLDHECACCVKDMSWKCILLLLSKSGHASSVSCNILKMLPRIFNDVNVPINLSHGTSSLLHKVLRSALQSFSPGYISELLTLVTELEVAVQSPNMLKSFSAIGLLLDIASNLEKLTKDVSITCQSSAERSRILKIDANRLDLVHFAGNVVTKAIDKMGSLKHVNENYCQPSASLFAEVKQQCVFILHLVLCVMKSYPELYPDLLNRIRSLMDIHCFGKVVPHSLYLNEVSHKGSHLQQNPCIYMENVSFRDISFDIALCIVRFVNASLCMCYRTDIDTREVYTTVSQIVECVKQEKNSDYALFEANSLQIRSVAISCYDTKTDYNGTDRSVLRSSSNSSTNVYWFHCERAALQFAKGMQKRNKNWTLYRAGKTFTSEGLWLAATFCFRKIVDQVQSKTCSLWLKSLMLLAGAESELRSLVFPKLSMTLINLLQSDDYCGNLCAEVDAELGLDIDGNVSLLECERTIPGVFNKISSSVEMLTSPGMSNMIFCFQQWFISLRGRVLETVHKVFKFLIFFNEGNLDSWALHLAEISSQFNKIAKEYDLLCSSFLDMDIVSVKSITVLALGCSLLAFLTASILFNPKTPTCNNLLSHYFPFFREHIQDLSERVWGIDDRCLVEVMKFVPDLLSFGEKLQSRSNPMQLSSTEKDTVAVLWLAISSISHFHEEMEAENCPATSRGNKVVEILFEILRKWLELPFHFPKFYFRIRPCTYVHVFVFQANANGSNEITVPVGEHLSINICTQLRNACKGVCAKISKIFCVLSVSSSECNRKEKAKHLMDGCSILSGSILVDMHEKLLLYMKKGTEKHSRSQICADVQKNQAISCVCLESNSVGQGFTTCLLNVSAFPEGTYHIMLHTCCMDNDGSMWSLPSLCSAHMVIYSSSNVI